MVRWGGRGSTPPKLSPSFPPQQKKALMALKKQQNSTSQASQGGIKRCELDAWVPCGKGSAGSPRHLGSFLREQRSLGVWSQ